MLKHIKKYEVLRCNLKIGARVSGLGAREEQLAISHREI